MTFESEKDRRSYFLERLREKLPDLRERADFPIGEDEDILRLSDPPYHTACPNPFLADFVAHHGHPYDPDEVYHRGPFAVDVSEGKNDALYSVHSYHTKVPPKAIHHYLRHYTAPGDVVLDAFCGTGMTGVAVERLGALLGSADHAPSRATILTDLSPIASFITSNMLRPLNPQEFEEHVDRICDEITSVSGHLYQTSHNGWRVRDRKRVPHKTYAHKAPDKGTVEFTLYSEFIRCPSCDGEFPLYDLAVDEENDSMRRVYTCPRCDKKGQPSDFSGVKTSQYDPVLGCPVDTTRIEPVLINYSVGTTRFEKLPDDHDDALVGDALARLRAGGGMPVAPLHGGREILRNVGKGIQHVHQFFPLREQHFIGELLRRIASVEDYSLRSGLMFGLTASLPYTSYMRRFRADRRGGGPLSGTLYVGSLATPLNVLRTFSRNAKTIASTLAGERHHRSSHAVGTQSATELDQLPDNSIDYVFTDPPFGENLMYSQLNFVWESLLRVRTNANTEAVIDPSLGKMLPDYGRLMRLAFEEMYRVLKPGRWLTVVFSSTKASVWNSIQSAIESSGMVVANVAALDKRQLGFKAIMTPTAVKQDLVISAYKPNGGLGTRFGVQAGSAKGVWDFVRTHLRQLPIIVTNGNGIEVIAERQPYMLFDRMVAFHVQRGFAVPLSLADFREGLVQRFPERDGMFFLPEQVTEYDRKRLTVGEVRQQELFVKDEESAIQWLRQQLARKPQSFQDIHPDFIRELAGWQKHERMLELSELLAQNFLHYDGIGEVPTQIHAYLSTNFKDFRNLRKDAPRLQRKAKDRWYVPDPNRAGDLETLRERSLLKEFDEYVASTARRLRLFRLEALRAGFRRAWQARDYATVVGVANKIPETVLQEDPKLLMWYDQSFTRIQAE